MAIKKQTLNQLNVVPQDFFYERKINKVNPFEYRRPTTEQVEMIERMRKACNEVNDLIDEIPWGQFNRGYIGMATSKLEEVSMWANKAIVFHDGTVSPDCGGGCASCKCDDEAVSEDMAVGDMCELTFMPGVVEGVMVVESADEEGGG